MPAEFPPNVAELELFRCILNGHRESCENLAKLINVHIGEPGCLTARQIKALMPVRHAMREVEVYLEFAISTMLSQEDLIKESADAPRNS